MPLFIGYTIGPRKSIRYSGNITLLFSMEGNNDVVNVITYPETPTIAPSTPFLSSLRTNDTNRTTALEVKIFFSD